MKGIILHGGYGTRLRPLTHTGPKQLIPVANKPISQYVLEDLIKAGINEITIVLGNNYPEKVKEYYGDGSKFGAKITYVHQGEPKGIAHAVGLCKQFAEGDPFVVHLGDDLLKGGINEFVKEFKDSDYQATVLLSKVKNPQRFGVAQFDAYGKLTKLVEKPKEPPSEYALVGVYFLRSAIFKMIDQLKPSWRGELEITEAIQLLLDHGYTVDYKFVDGWWKDTGNPEDILESNRLLLDDLKHEIRGIVEPEATLQGRAFVGENSIVKHNSILRGPVSIGKNTTIESGVYVGPYTSIGNNVIIKKGEIENSIIMDNCLIDVNERITDSLIGPYSTITTDQVGKPKGYRFTIGDWSKITL